MMVGRTIYEEAPQVPEQPDPTVVLEVRGLSRGRAVRDVSFQLRRGEILGVAGLVGAGRTELGRLIFGADRRDSGEILVNGRTVDIDSPATPCRLRHQLPVRGPQAHGLALGLDVETNVAMASYRRFLRVLGQVNTRLTRSVAEQRVQELGIKTPSVRQKARNLSGGTQQKVVVAKWLTAETEILIFDEPTRGIDVGAKQEIYHLLNHLAAAGQVDHHDLVGAARDPAHEPPHPRHVRGAPDR